MTHMALMVPSHLCLLTLAAGDKPGQEGWKGLVCSELGREGKAAGTGGACWHSQALPERRIRKQRKVM